MFSVCAFISKVPPFTSTLLTLDKGPSQWHHLSYVCNKPISKQGHVLSYWVLTAVCEVWKAHSVLHSILLLLCFKGWLHAYTGLMTPAWAGVLQVCSTIVQTQNLHTPFYSFAPRGLLTTLLSGKGVLPFIFSLAVLGRRVRHHTSFGSWGTQLRTAPCRAITFHFRMLSFIGSHS